MRATAEPVEANLVRLSVEIDEDDVERVLNDAVTTLTRQARIPGFRPGKVPRQVLVARMGGVDALRAEAIREAIPDFYAQAVAETDVDPIAAPEIDITAGEESGPVSFDAVVQVRPVVTIPGYAGLQVTIPSPEATDADIDVQVDRMRETEAELVAVSRPARDGDNLTIDLHGTARGEEVVGADDFLYEVGSGRVVPELDDELRGSKVGDVLAFDATAGEDRVSFRVLVKDVKEKKLPDLTDEWVAESSEFSSLDELRADLRGRVEKIKRLQASLAAREGALSALTDLVENSEIPEVLVDEEVRERVHDLQHRLESQKMTLEQFLAASGKSGDDLVNDVRVEAHRAVKIDLALRALADAEGITVSDDELAEELAAMAERMNADPDELRRRLDHAGRTTAVRSEQKKAKALSWLLEHVEMVDEEGKPVSAESLRLPEVGESGPEQGGEDAETSQSDEVSRTEGDPRENGEE